MKNKKKPLSTWEKLLQKKWKNEMFDTKKYCVCVFLYLYNIYHKKNKK